MSAGGFEDLAVWQQARQLVRDVYGVTRKGDFSKDFGLRDQMQRAAVSVPSNIAEGYERGSGREFLQFLFFAKGSAGEVRSQLYNALYLGHILEEEHYSLNDSVRRISAGLSNMITSIQRSEEMKGRRGEEFKGSRDEGLEESDS